MNAMPRQVFSLALAMLKDRDKAADLTQEIFLLVWRMPAFTARRVPREHGSAACAQSRHRRTATHPASAAVHMSVSDETSSQHTASSTAFLDICAQQEVREAVAALPALHREALLLAFFHGLSHQRDFYTLQTPLGTIKARIRRALLTLRQQLLDKERSS